jgi:hypothetical protein
MGERLADLRAALSRLGVGAGGSSGGCREMELLAADEGRYG